MDTGRANSVGVGGGSVVLDVARSGQQVASIALNLPGQARFLQSFVGKAGTEAAEWLTLA